MLSKRDTQEIIRTNQVALECTTLSELQDEVLSRLERNFNTSTCFFHPRHITSWRLDFAKFASRGFPDDFSSMYLDKYHKLDPFAKHIRDFNGVQNWTVSLGENLTDQKKLIQSEFYKNFMGRFSMHHSMLIVLATQKRQIGLIGLFRKRNEPNFSMQDINKACLMAPSLTGALTKTFLYRELKECEFAIESVLKSLHYQGLVIIDEHMNPVFMNSEAFKLCVQTQQNMGQATAVDTQIFKMMTKRCAELMADFYSSGQIDTPDCYFEVKPPGTDGSYTVYMRLVSDGNSKIHFVVFFDSDSYTKLVAKWAKMQGLTPRETDVLLLVQMGLRNYEIANKLFISLPTVQTHLTHIFEKLEVRNRISLVSKILNNSRTFPQPSNFH